MNLDISPFAVWDQRMHSITSRDRLRSYNVFEIVEPMMSSQHSQPDPIFAACASGFLDVVKSRLGDMSERKWILTRATLHFRTARARTVALETRNYLGEMCLHIAGRLGHPDIVRVLLKNGANMEAEMENSTPLQLASLRGCVSVVQILLEGVSNINAQNACGEIALWVAVLTSQYALMQLLLSKKDVQVDAAARDISPLSLAVLQRCKESVQLLLQNSVNIRTKSWKGECVASCDKKVLTK